VMFLVLFDQHSILICCVLSAQSIFFFRIHHFFHSASYKAHIFNDVLAAEEARAKAEAKAERLRKQAQKHLISFSYFFFGCTLILTVSYFFQPANIWGKKEEVDSDEDKGEDQPDEEAVSASQKRDSNQTDKPKKMVKSILDRGDDEDEDDDEEEPEEEEEDPRSATQEHLPENDLFTRTTVQVIQSLHAAGLRTCVYESPFCVASAQLSSSDKAQCGM
jgi:hypothetical protein